MKDPTGGVRHVIPSKGNYKNNSLDEEFLEYCQGM